MAIIGYFNFSLVTVIVHANANANSYLINNYLEHFWTSINFSLNRTIVITKNHNNSLLICTINYCLKNYFFVNNFVNEYYLNHDGAPFSDIYYLNLLFFPLNSTFTTTNNNYLSFSYYQYIHPDVKFF